MYGCCKWAAEWLARCGPGAVVGYTYAILMFERLLELGGVPEVTAHTYSIAIQTQYMYCTFVAVELGGVPEVTSRIYDIAIIYGVFSGLTRYTACI